jgi:hypothetical protein
MHKIVFLDRATFAPQITLRRPGFEHVWIEHERTAAADVGERLAGASIAINNKAALRREALEKRGAWQAAGQLCFFNQSIRDLSGSASASSARVRSVRAWQRSPAPSG